MDNKTSFTTEYSIYNVSVIDYTDYFNTTTKSVRRWVHVFLEWGLLVGVVMALFGNTIVIIVMTSKKNRNSAAAMFFTALSVSDLFIIIFGSFDTMLKHFTDYGRFGNRYFIIFKNVTWLTSVYTSSWLIVFIALERTISVTFPYKYSTICTMRKKISAVIIIVTVFLTMNMSFHLVFWTIHTEDGDEDWRDNIPNISRMVEWLDAVLVFFVPAFLLITGSSCIIRGLTKSASKLRANGSNNSNGKKTRNNSIIWILLASVIVFLLTMSPFYVLFVLDDQGLVSESEIIDILWDIFIFLKDMNAALNCYVYFLTGSKFRNDVKCLFCKLCKSQTNVQSNRS
ncbi:hypothetical protein ACF0H5_013658 [Mactra antiquata]